MDEFGITRFEGIAKRKRSQTSRRPKPEPQASQPSDDLAKVSSDDTSYDGSSKRKVFNLNQCALRGLECENAHKKIKKDDGGSTILNNGLNHKQLNEGAVAHSGHSGGIGGNFVSESKVKKVKLKVGGVTRTIQTKSTSHATLEIRPSTKNTQSSDASRQRPKLILQDNSDEDNSPPPDKNCGLQGIPWKDFLGKEELSMGKNASRKQQGERLDQVRKSKRAPKKRDLNGDFDEDEEDDEIRYLEKLRTSRVSKGSGSCKDVKKSRSDKVSEDMDYEEEEPMSDGDPEGKKKKKKPMKDLPDSPTENKKEMSLTTRRQRALLSSKDVSGANQIEFPNGLPPPAPRKQKEKLTEVEQQLKKAEAAERRRIQSEKAARESEAEAIRKILGQESSRKKKEDKLKKRQEELAQEKAANAHTIPPGMIRTVMGPTGTTVTFSEDIGLPHIFDSKPHSYPPPREKCAGPNCNNPYRYRDSKTQVPLCSLQCYKAVQGKVDAKKTD